MASRGRRCPRPGRGRHPLDLALVPNPDPHRRPEGDLGENPRLARRGGGGGHGRHDLGRPLSARSDPVSRVVGCGPPSSSDPRLPLRLGRGQHHPPPFRGFPPEAFDFYARLVLDNSKAFWTANREVYEGEVREPFRALAAELEPEVGTFHMFRPHRDVRFSKDKSPYKTGQGMATEGEGGEVYYLHLDAEGLFAATGYHQMARDQLRGSGRPSTTPRAARPWSGSSPVWRAPTRSADVSCRRHHVATRGTTSGWGSCSTRASPRHGVSAPRSGRRPDGPRVGSSMHGKGRRRSTTG